MPRRREVQKRDILPDAVYGSQRLARFTNTLMKNGKKSIAEKIIYAALDHVDQRLKKSKKGEEDTGSTGEAGSAGGTGKQRLLEYFEQALDNVRPTVEVRSRRVGGATYQVPVEVRLDRSIALGMRWIAQAARLRSEKGMIARLASELQDAFEGKGSAVKKREDTHKMAKANQAFAHFKWH